MRGGSGGAAALRSGSMAGDPELVPEMSKTLFKLKNPVIQIQMLTEIITLFYVN